MPTGTQTIREDMVAWISKNQVKNTKATYGTYARKYKTFCEEQNLPIEDPAVISMFLREGMEKRNLSATTLNDVVASSISDIFRMEKIKPTHDPLVRETKKVIARLGKKGPGGKIPLPLKMLKKFVQISNPHRVNDIRDIFLFILMFGGLLRESEAAALKTEDVWVVDGNLYVVVKKSKTDQESISRTVVLAKSKTSSLCPTSWFNIYMKEREKLPGIYLFHNTSRPGHKLSAKRPNGVLKEWLKKIGVSEDDRKLYGSHSMRKGGATAAAKAKVRIHVLKRHGRWKSDAVFLYIVDDEGEKLSVSKAILGSD